LRGEQRLFGGGFGAALAESPGARLARLVRTHTAGRSGVGVFVPPSNVEFWKLTPGCRTIYHVQPSISGAPSLLGAPPRALGCEPDAYQGNYGRDVYSRALGDAELCQYAQRRGLNGVLILNTLRDDAANRLLDCKGT
jgi:hypothetical protein